MGATILGEKLEKLMPEIGFIVEEMRTINGDQDKLETELRFTRPSQEQSPSSGTIPTEKTTTVEPPSIEPTTKVIVEDAPQIPSISESTGPTLEVLGEDETPPMLEIVQPPSVGGQKITRLERTMLKSAIRAITERRQPVPYRELLNEVYMDLVDHKVEFDSARQIETTLLNHNGREVILLDEADGLEQRIIKKWGLGKQKLRSERSHRIPVLNRVKAVTPKITNIRKIIRRPRKSRYKARAEDRDDNGDPSSGG